jgi:hypothetical protein
MRLHASVAVADLGVQYCRAGEGGETVDYDHEKFVRELSDVLTTDPAIGVLDLYIGKGNRLHVSGTGLRITGAFVRSKRIAIVVDTAYLDSENAEAQYESRSNRLFVREDWVRMRGEVDSGSKYATPDAINPDPGTFRNTGRRRAVLVHEATHAWIDYRKFDVIDRRNEAAAWLAGVVYAYHSGVLGELLSAQVYPADPLWKTAHDVARAHNLYSAKGAARLLRRDIKPLLACIGKHYNRSAAARTLLDGIDDD